MKYCVLIDIHNDHGIGVSVNNVDLVKQTASGDIGTYR